MPAGDRCARAHAQSVFPWGKPLLSVRCRQYHCAREASEINEDAATSSTGPIAHQQRDGEIRDGNCEEGSGQEGRSEEGSGEEGRSEEGTGKEGLGGEEGRGEEGPGEEAHPECSVPQAADAQRRRLRNGGGGSPRPGG